MSEDIKAGDVVICVDDSPPRRMYFVVRGWRFPFRRGSLHRVRALAQAENGEWGLLFVGHSAGNYERTGREVVFAPSRFRKLDAPKTEIFSRIRSCRPNKTRQPA